MTLNTLINASSGAAMTDNLVSTIRDWLYTNWPSGGASGNSELVKANISYRVDSFDDTNPTGITQDRIILLEPMPTSIKYAFTGGARYRVSETVRVQLYFSTPSKFAERGNVEREILQMINANLDALKTSGIQQMHIDQFVPFSNVSDSQLSQGVVANIPTARSVGLIQCKYDLTKVGSS